MIDLSTLKPNPDNPRGIEEEKFEKLKESIARDPKFMKLNPIKVDQDKIIIAGNMRYRALLALEFKSIPDEWIQDASDLTEEERRRFIIIDNLGYGFTDWDIITSHYNEEELVEWGMDLPIQVEDVTEDPPPISHAFKIKCEDMDELIELREMLDCEPDKQSMSFGKFKLIFENRLS